MKKSVYSLIFFIFFYFLSSASASADVLNQVQPFNLNPEYEYLGRSNVSATLKKISDRAYWYVSDDYWGEIAESQRSLFLQKLDELAGEFDSRIYPIETSFWGSEWNPGIDDDSRITVLIAKLIDRAGGYYDTSHEYEKSRVPESNQREMVFINASSLFNGRAKIFLAHEFQHLIEFYQKEKLRDAADDIWLNELRSEYSIKLMGYDDNFNNSNLERRLYAFSNSPSEPLAEWKNLASDYGTITLFSYYLSDHYGDKILSDSLKSKKVGIESLNEALLLNGFNEAFPEIFSNWTVASILNDESVDPKFAYKLQHLKNTRISANQSYSISGVGGILDISNSVKDWQPVWYEFNTPINSGSGLNLKINFSAGPETEFKIPYIAFNINGKKEIGHVPFNGTAGTYFFKNFSSEIYKVVLIPTNYSKTGGFTDNDPESSFNLSVRLVTEFEEASPNPVPSPAVKVSNLLIIEDLINQIAVLQNQIAQLKQSSQASPPLTRLGNLNRNLFVGTQGDDVKWFQEFLIKEKVYPEARITGYFGLLTKNAVIRFQQKYGISPQIGYVGSKTRIKIQELVK